MKKTCCPQYTIRCDARAFNLSRSHKKVIKRVNKYLNFGTIPDKNEHSDEVSHPSASDYPQRDFDTANVNVESGNEVPKLATADRKLSPEATENTSVAATAAVLNSAVDTVKHHQPKPGENGNFCKWSIKVRKLAWQFYLLMKSLYISEF